MKKLFYHIAAILLTTIFSAPFAKAGDTTLVTCSASINIAGPTTDTIITIQSSPMSRIKVNYDNILVYPGYGSFLSVHDGPDTNATIISYVDENNPSPNNEVSTNTTITIRAKIMASDYYSYFHLSVLCFVQPQIAQLCGYIPVRGQNFSCAIKFSGDINLFDFDNLQNVRIVYGPNNDTLVASSNTVQDVDSLTFEFSPLPCTLPNGNALLQFYSESNIDSTIAQTVINIEGIANMTYNLQNPTCYNGNDGVIQVLSVSGGASPYFYLFIDSTNFVHSGNPFDSIGAGTYIIEIYDNNGCSIKDTVELLNPPQFSLSINGISDTTLCLGSSMVLNAIQSNGAMPISYFWGTDPTLFYMGVGQAQVIPTDTTLYYLNALDANGCTAYADITVNVLPRPSVTSITALNDSICNGSTTNITLNDGGTSTSLTWTPVTGLDNPTSYTPVASPTVTTFYTATLINGYGCKKDTAVKVTVIQPITVSSITPDTNVCQTSSAIDLNVLGINVTNFSWTTNGTGSFDNATNPIATYTLSSSDQTALDTLYFYLSMSVGNTICPMAYDTVKVVLDKLPSTAQPGSNIVQCNNSNFTLSATNPVIGVGTWSVVYGSADLINSSSPNALANNVAPGDSVVLRWTVSNGNCLSSFDQIYLKNLAPPNFDLLPIQACSNAPTVNAYVSGDNTATYSWQPSTYLQNTTGMMVEVNLGGNITYTVTGTSTEGCSLQKFVNAELITAPDAGVAGFNSSAYCSDPSLVINLLPNTTGGTFGGTGVAAISGWDFRPGMLTPGSYDIWHEIQDGVCTSTETYSFTILPNPTAQINVLSPLNCSGLNGQLELVATGGTAPYSYSWSNGVTSAINSSPIVGLNQGYVTDINGCTAMADTNLQAGAEIIFSNIQVVQPNCNLADGSIAVSVSGGVPPYSYSWCSGSQDTILNNIASGTYCLHVSDSAGCFKDTSIVLNYAGTYPYLDGVVNVGGNPANNDVWAILFEKSSGGAYITKDSVLVDGSGYYLFNNLDVGEYIVAASPLLTSYPNGITTFMSGGLPTHRWETADVHNLQCNTSAAHLIELINLLTPSGNATVSGTILDVTVRDSTDTLFRIGPRRPGEPIRGIDIILEDRPGNNVVMRTQTDSVGRFEFNNVEVGNYQIYVLVPGCGMISTYALTVSGTDFLFDRDFYVDSVAGTIDTVTTVRLPSTTGIIKSSAVADKFWTVYPNPFSNRLTVDLNLERDDLIRVKITDVTGKQVWAGSYEAKSGKNNIQMDLQGNTLSRGFYFIEIVGNRIPASKAKILKD